MCDYSLHSVASRPAKAGDDLVTTSFATTSTRGFAAADDPDVAVCLRPGTELAFEKDVAWRRPLRMLFRKPQPSGRLARFRQINLERPDTHHDAIELPDGQVVLLNDLRPGQKATVLQLPVSPRQDRRPLHVDDVDSAPAIDLTPADQLPDRSEWFFRW